MTNEPYHEGSRALQDRFDTRRLADRGAELMFGPEPRIGPRERAFVERMEMVFVGTADADGIPHCSYKGGAPGFVRVLDERTLAIPNYDGNGFFDSWGNVAVNPNVDLLFIDFEADSPWRLRIKGTAALEFDGPLLADHREAQFVVRITPTRIYPVCPRYVHQMQIVRRSRFVPADDATAATPVAQWKLDGAEVPPEVLAADDPSRRESERLREGGAPQPPTHGPFPS
jgi:predicted pyridoxine 5'-phosphate oxidase superfamily flavin-nucleotide-binding protein